MKNFKKGFGVVGVLIIIVAVLVVGGGAYYMGKNSKEGNKLVVEENNLLQENTKIFKLGDLEFSYPEILTFKKDGEVVSLGHSIAQKHQNYCDFKGDGIVVDAITDFQAFFKIYNKDLVNSIKSDFPVNSVIQNLIKDSSVTLDLGFIDKYKIGSFDGYKITNGVEGCGHYSYYLSISPNQTLVISRSFYAQTVMQTRDARMLKLPGIISREQEEQIFKNILLSVKGFNKGKKVVDNMEADCLPTTTPWIKVLSPNGGETYTAGQQITVKWETCNIVGNNYEQSIYLLKPSKLDVDLYRLATVSPRNSYLNSPATFDIPADISGNNIHISIKYSERINGISSGKFYEGRAAQPFTINSKNTISTNTDPYKRYISKDCKVVSGCNGPIECVNKDSEPMASACVASPEFICYKTNTARCEKQASGDCGWTNTETLKSCLKNYSNRLF